MTLLIYSTLWIAFEQNEWATTTIYFGNAYFKSVAIKIGKKQRMNLYFIWLVSCVLPIRAMEHNACYRQFNLLYRTWKHTFKTQLLHVFNLVINHAKERTQVISCVPTTNYWSIYGLHYFQAFPLGQWNELRWDPIMGP